MGVWSIGEQVVNALADVEQSRWPRGIHSRAATGLGGPARNCGATARNSRQSNDLSDTRKKHRNFPA
jgi:hypothetical protein